MLLSQDTAISAQHASTAWRRYWKSPQEFWYSTRSDIHTTKLRNNSHHPDDVPKALDASLKDLGVDYLDFYLMHWPSPFARRDTMMPKDENDKVQTGDTDYVNTYKAMEKCLKSGKAKTISTFNFSKAELEGLLKKTSVVSEISRRNIHHVLHCTA